MGIFLIFLLLYIDLLNQKMYNKKVCGNQNPTAFNSDFIYFFSEVQDEKNDD